MTLKYFFSRPEDIPLNLTWNTYGVEHLIWLFAITLFIVYMCRMFKKADYEKQNKILKILAIVIVIQEIIKDIIHIYAGTFNLGHLPFHLCGISIFFTFWYAFKPGKICGEYLYALSLPGAMAALLFPDWTGYPMLHFSCINSFTIHAWLVVFVFMLLYSGRLKPNYKVLPKTALLVGIIAVPVYFMNKAWGTNFMFLSAPAPGSPLEILYNVFGNFYIPAALLLVLFVWVLMYAPWQIAYSRQNKMEEIV